MTKKYQITISNSGTEAAKALAEKISQIIRKDMPTMIMEKVSRYHAIERTSPKGPGQKFLGTCWQCGKTGLTMADTAEKCENVSRLTEEESLIMAIKGPKDA